MDYSEDEQRAFYRRQMRHLLDLVQGCNDARTVAALLQATTYRLKKIEERRSALPDDGGSIFVVNHYRSVLH